MYKCITHLCFVVYFAGLVWFVRLGKFMHRPCHKFPSDWFFVFFCLLEQFAGLGMDTSNHEQKNAENRFALKMHQKTLKIMKRRKISGFLVNVPDLYIINLTQCFGWTVWNSAILPFEKSWYIGWNPTALQTIRCALDDCMIGILFWQSPAPPTFFSVLAISTRDNKHGNIHAGP